MKAITLTLAIICATCAFTFAGPERYDTKEVVQQAPPPESCFAGWYFGAQGGATISNFNSYTSADEASLGARGIGFAEAFDSARKDDGSSFEGGLHAGYNWKHGGWIFGFEVDLSATALNQHQQAAALFDSPSSPDLIYNTVVNSKSTIDWYSTERVRLGHTLGDRIFLYGTGGFAFGGAELQENTSIFAYRSGEDYRDDRSGYASNQSVKVGWTAGAGMDFCLTQHWILNFTYLYVDLGDQSVGNDIGFVGQGEPRLFRSISHASTENNFHVAQAGLSFKF